MSLEKQINTGKLVNNGLLYGLAAGSACGFLESVFVTVSGFNIPLVRILFIYGTDSIIGASAGMAIGMVVWLAARFSAAFSGRYSIGLFSACAAVTGVVFLQGLVFIYARTGASSYAGAILAVFWLLAAIALFSVFYSVSDENDSFTGPYFMLKISCIELVLMTGAYMNTVYFNWSAGFRSIAANIMLLLAGAALFLLTDRFSPGPGKTDRSRDGLTEVHAVMMLSLLLALSMLSWYVIQPRFPVTGNGEPGSTGPQAGLVDSSERPNIILISIDTLRADHLGSYGYPKPVSPFMDKLASEGTRFGFAVSQSPWTLPSHASLMTSMYPSQHGANRPTTKLASDLLTMAEILGGHSYVTAAFTGGGWISGNLGFSGGFQVYDDNSDLNLNCKYKPIPFLLDLPVFSAKTSFSYSVPKILAWLRSNYDKKDNFFLFIHTFEVHNYFYNDIKLKPYLKKLGVEYDGNMDRLTNGDKRLGNNVIKNVLTASNSDMAYIKALYDAEILYTDELLSRIFEELEHLGIEDRTLVILTSDHGEGFESENQRVHHGGRLHNDQIHVPLILKFPGVVQANRTIEEPVELIDILPSVVDILNIPGPEQLQGRVLPGLSGNSGSEQERAVFSEELGYRFADDCFREAAHGDYRMTSVISDNIKIIKSPDAKEVYDLDKDPGETRNLVNINSSQAEKAEHELDTFIETNTPRFSFPDSFAGEEGGIREDTRERLKSLGYL